MMRLDKALSWKCLGCQNVIYATTLRGGRKRVFCTINCAHRVGYTRRRELKIMNRFCLYCKKPLAHNRPLNTKYCNYKCRDKLTMFGIKVCVNCNRDLTPLKIRRKYCSELCASIAYHTNQLIELKQIFSLR